MGGVCCCGGSAESKSEQKEPKEKKGAKGGNDLSGELFKAEYNENSDERRLIGEEKLKEEMKSSFKAAAADDGYAKIKKETALNRKKSLQPEEYNKKGLIADGSEEYKSVKKYLEAKEYAIDCSIGSGNYAEVYKAYNKDRKPVAVKVIGLKKANADYRLKMLPKEIKVLSHCKHKNIIKMYEIAQSGNRVYMIMEFAPMGTLTDWLKDKGAFSEGTAHVMFTQILAAVHHMHFQSIAHRDLKLENILITQKLNPKVSDFSYAMKVDPKSPKSTTFCGSLPYFSAEILQRFPHNPIVSDIWSLGVCFYIMLNDGLPFPLGNDKLMLQKQLNREWKFRPKVEPKLSPELKAMIRRMLEPDMNARATSDQLRYDPWIKNYKEKANTGSGYGKQS